MSAFFLMLLQLNYQCKFTLAILKKKLDIFILNFRETFHNDQLFKFTGRPRINNSCGNSGFSQAVFDTMIAISVPIVREPLHYMDESKNFKTGCTSIDPG